MAGAPWLFIIGGAVVLIVGVALGSLTWRPFMRRLRRLDGASEWARPRSLSSFLFQCALGAVLAGVVMVPIGLMGLFWPSS